MGSMISLGIDRFEIDWGKNHSFTDHSALFLPSDVALIPYYYADDEVEIKEGYSRKLRSIMPRLDLLGYTSQSLSRIFQEHLDAHPDYYPDVPITFEQFRSVMRSIDLSKAALDLESEDYDLGEFVSRNVFADPELRQYLPDGALFNNDIGTFFENLHPYLILRLLAENEENLDRFVQWRFSDIVDGGWVARDEVVKPLSDDSKILVVTEGSSDTYVIKRSLIELFPDISDFFDFIDMEKQYPFTGTGNLYNFCQGLARIHIQNKVLAIFDNDAAGMEKFQQSQSLTKPRNLHICRLPDHNSFSQFPTIGPNGMSNQDINGSAVSIECFLDLRTIPECDRLIRWTGFNYKTRSYQGAFERKDDLISEFKNATFTGVSYDTTKLRFLLEYLINEWVSSQEF